jgi:hypothetical protein
MVEEIGRINRPAAANYEGKRKLLLAPLVQSPAPAEHMPAEGTAVVGSYWQQVDAQIRAVQNALGSITHVYHENMPEGGESGLGYLEATGQGSHAVVRALTHAGASLENTESIEILAESLDLQRFLMGPIMSQTVATRVQEWLIEATRRRYAHIAEVIDSTLGDDETGLLLINERHQVQFPSDIEVIYVAPPALDEFRRWLQNWTQQMQSAASTEDHSEDDDSDDDQSDGEDPTQDPGDDEPEP